MCNLDELRICPDWMVFLLFPVLATKQLPAFCPMSVLGYLPNESLVICSPWKTYPANVKLVSESAQNLTTASFTTASTS